MSNSSVASPSLEDVRAFNAGFKDYIQQHSDGIMKRASATTENYTRRIIREDAVWRAYLPPKKYSKSELNKFLEGEKLGVICEMEPYSMGPKVVTFNDTPEQAEYSATRYILPFFQITTPEFTKNVLELMTYDMDLREVVTDNALRDMSRMEDIHIMKFIDEIVGAEYGVLSSETGLMQNVMFNGRLTRDNWVSTLSILEDAQLNNGTYLCNRRTFKEFMRWTRNEMGGDFTEELFREGTGAFRTAEVSGIKFIITIKDYLVPNGVIYLFAPPNYLGKSGVFQEPTMYVKKEKKILRFSCDEIIGCTFANTAAVAKASFAAAMGVYGGDGRVPAGASPSPAIEYPADPWQGSLGDR